MSEPTYEELKARLAAAEEQLKGGRARGTINFKVSEKGAVSVYGLGRFPVTLYYEQWVRLLDQADELRQFLEANKASLKLKEHRSVALPRGNGRALRQTGRPDDSSRMYLRGNRQESFRVAASPIVHSWNLVRQRGLTG